MGKPRTEWGDYKLFRAINEIMEGALFHITDCANAASINELGLLSKFEAEALGVCPVRPGGDSLTHALDMQRGLVDYVFLGFNCSGVMPKDQAVDRYRRPLILHIDPAIVLEPGVMVSLGRSTRSRMLSSRAAFYNMDWPIFLSPQLREEFGGKARWNEFLNYEILVPKCVPRHFIVGAEI